MPRKEKVQDAIQKEVCSIIQKELKDPRLGFITITEVDISDDLRNAKIFYSVLGDEAQAKKTQEALDSALGLIRTLIAERIQLRFAPEIIFRQDRSAQYSMRIQEVLDQIKEMDSRKDEEKEAKDES
ncbi:MAG: 30S ribosome-binding factor RbfA [Candidatus Omnitrophica bacterium]|jgi:ribosome-binding factor A|nr:30S ribosome-binding factor RbfA [Candidatus Omnitrophota bacterium]MDD5078778.1 30S ribosome-binding factor RbfA [Candidatus Omnitrophota bacterium]